ncbi:hypothetical protein [Paenibacillus campi]|uniref:hypothetical protein n=1 Tax=Paenibacillus campi TaxID=3106031 RepID=UPI002AFE5F0A|nr:hypothetical protein [Paenibacillus sp. SGZ-1014]
MKFIRIAIATIALLLVLFVATVYVVNVVANYAEQQQIQPYGQAVMVAGKKMNVFMQSTSKGTIVLLPCFATVSPVLDFKPLIEQ